MEELMKKFDECLDTWIDLHQYVYTEEYRNVFIEFAKKKESVGQKLEPLIATMALHHETDGRHPYFKFNRM